MGPVPKSTFASTETGPDSGVVVKGILVAAEGIAVDERQANEINKGIIMNRLVVLCLNDNCVFIGRHPMGLHRHQPNRIRRRALRLIAGED